MSSRLFVCLAGLALCAVGAGCAAPDEDDDSESSDLALVASTATADATNLYYRMPISRAPTWARIFLDTDRDASSGFRAYGIGAQYMFENGNLYRYSGAGGGWGWTKVKNVAYRIGHLSVQVTIARADLGSPAGIDLVTQTDPPLQTSAKITQLLSGSSAPAPAPAPGPAPTGPTPITGPAYYVSPSGSDGNPGIQASPWRTIQKAADTASAGDPCFVSATSDWHLQAGSLALNAGAAVSLPAYGGGTLDISRDKNGVARSTPWDLGVYAR